MKTLLSFILGLVAINAATAATPSPVIRGPGTTNTPSAWTNAVRNIGIQNNAFKTNQFTTMLPGGSVTGTVFYAGGPVSVTNAQADGFGVVTMTGTGRVGIGTASPGTALSFGTSLFTTGGGIALYESGGGANFYGFKVSSGSIDIYAGAVQVAKFADDANNDAGVVGGMSVGYALANPPSMGMIISGNVGIGTNVPATKLDVQGNVKFGGNGTLILSVRHGVSGAMVLGTVTVTDAGCTANTRYFFSAHTLGTISIPGGYYASTRTAGTSFVITSSQATETSTIDWMAVEP